MTGIKNLSQPQKFVYHFLLWIVRPLVFTIFPVVAMLVFD